MHFIHNLFYDKNVKRIIIFVFFLVIFGFLFLFNSPRQNVSYAATCASGSSPCDTSAFTGAIYKCCAGTVCNKTTKLCVPDTAGGSTGGTGTGTGTGIGTGTTPLPKLTTTGCGTGTYEVWTLDCIFPLMQSLINWALAFAGVVALFLIIYSGIKFIVSGDDQKNVEASKKTLTYAIAGLVLILLSFLIINIIAYATGVSCIKLMGFKAC